MARAYGFLAEIRHYAENGEIRVAFFEKLRDLVRRRARKYPPGLLVVGAASWSEEAVDEVAVQFATGYLFDRNNLRVNYLVDASRKEDNLDGLLVRLFDQFLVDALEKKKPRQANLIKRVRRRLSAMERAGELTSESGGKDKRFRRRQNALDHLVSGEELRQSAHLLPDVHPRVHQRGEKIPPIVSEVELENLLRRVFCEHAGWISEKTLWTFLFSYLEVLDGVEVCFSETVSREAKPDDLVNLTERIISTCGEQFGRTLIAEILGRLSARQRRILRLYYLEGLEPEAIMEHVGIRKSTFYQELTELREALSQIAVDSGI
jgi:RNA polymerase sigma factor (sigma-70 family)